MANRVVGNLAGIAILSAAVGTIACWIGAISKEARSYFLVPAGALVALLFSVLIFKVPLILIRSLRDQWRAQQDPVTLQTTSAACHGVGKVISRSSPTVLILHPSGFVRFAGWITLAAGMIPLLILVAALLSARGEDVATAVGFSILMLFIGLCFTLYGLGLLCLSWQFVFDKERGELRAGNHFVNHRFALTAIRSVDLREGAGIDMSKGTDIDGRSIDSPGEHRDLPTMECRLTMQIDKNEFQLSLWDQSNLRVSVSNAEQLAEFLDVPIGGDALDSFQR